ncbi:hypothetical protein Poli38472_008895 [Pythium oligandrum]|uniref:CCT domain-containing protein n=1 Tax=Pythium oligandrum TaxID=41045 RepID=A0A8K1C525_PYTOL|nr:hypothetical protein Poli38472_008895 [Pythium oligandrum]|eukprot:TMW56247.1 hypothetical protein Poli38472_008895 [Pythium oligandrum]
MPDTVTRAAEHELVQADGFAQLKVLRRANGTRMASASTLLPSPLHLDICVLPSYESLSRSSSWQDLTVYATEAKKMRAKDFFPPVLGDEDFRRRQASHPGTFIKTPTTQAFHTHDQERGRINPFKEHYSAMSPTTIDKKILVTENDLKLFSPKRQLEENPQEAEWGKPQRSGRIRRIRVYSERRFHPIHSFRMQMPKVTCKTPSYAPPLRRLPGLSQQLASDLGESRVPALRRLPASTKPTCQGAIHFRKGQATIHARPAHRAATPSAHKERGHKPKSRPVLAPAPVRVKTPKKIGIYSPEERRKRIERFLEKRKHRVFHKRVKYDCRKRLANACPRHKGRFARREVSKDDEDGEASDQKTDSTGE